MSDDCTCRKYGVDPDCPVHGRPGQLTLTRGLAPCWIFENSYLDPWPHKPHDDCPGYPVPREAYDPSTAEIPY